MGVSHRVRIGETRTVFRLLNEVVDLYRRPAVGDVDDVAQQHAITGVCQLVGARSGSAIDCAGWTPTGTLRVRSAVHGGWPNTSMFKAWRSGILPTDPRKDTLINKGTSINKDLVTRSREQILSPKEWERSWEYEILPDVDVGEHLVCWFRTDRSQDAVFAMTLHRPYGDRPFTVRQRNVLHLYNVELYRLFLDGVIPLCADNRPAELLTPRQKEVLARLLSGDGDKQVARRLGISVHTASDHVKAIYRRLGVNSRGELMAKYLGPAST